jgi:hypothetical protein
LFGNFLIFSYINADIFIVKNKKSEKRGIFSIKIVKKKNKKSFCDYGTNVT